LLSHFDFLVYLFYIPWLQVSPVAEGLRVSTAGAGDPHQQRGYPTEVRGKDIGDTSAVNSTHKEGILVLEQPSMAAVVPPPPPGGEPGVKVADEEIGYPAIPLSVPCIRPSPLQYPVPLLPPSPGVDCVDVAMQTGSNSDSSSQVR
jgi:hypothetical protein